MDIMSVFNMILLSPIHYELHVLMIMTYLAVLLYPLFTKPKQYAIEIIYGSGKFIGYFNMGRGMLLKILIWVHYKRMWIKNLPYMSY